MLGSNQHVETSWMNSAGRAASVEMSSQHFGPRPFVRTEVLPALIYDMQELKPGHQSEVMQRYAKEMPTSCCFTIVFKGRKENTDLVTLNGTEACHWIYVFTKLKKRDCNINRRVRLDQRRLWSVPGGTPQREGATSPNICTDGSPQVCSHAVWKSKGYVQQRGWKARVQLVEVGCRGFVARSTLRLLRELRVRGKTHRQAVKYLSRAAEKGSQRHLM
ncbi:uncharacterized protein [Hemitrygon akajei]|uniref:uncharacterized protein n=1 Tax=Hemitrygon akajei TaxID=2704970 RepID=UPI003BF9EDB7